MLILLWGLLDEAPMAAVAQALRHAGANIALLDQRGVLKTSVSIEVTSQIIGQVSSPGCDIDLAGVESAYIRPYDSRLLPAVANAKARAARERALAGEEILLTWCDITPALVVNRPRDAATNSSKPYQSRMIREVGFSVPETLITTSPEAVIEFHSRCERIIYKSLSGIRSRVSEFTDAHFHRLGDVRFCPTQFQKMIPGRDHRVHVVGDDVFACELLCDSTDYRYPGEEPLEIQSAQLPSYIEERCLLLCRSLRLPLAGIDLRRTPEDEWYCFEVNPSPAFTFYQTSTQQPIAAAIAALLLARAQPAALKSVADPEFLEVKNLGCLQDPVDYA